MRSLGLAGAVVIAVALAAPAHADVSGLAPFVGRWAGMRERIEIRADGFGTYSHMIPCPNCSMADMSYSDMTFALTSVSGTTATGTISGDTKLTGVAGEPIAISVVSATATAPATINVGLNGGQGPMMCPASNASWCGG